jgi:alpha-beta hydrolase superfamily lysophospholipase
LIRLLADDIGRMSLRQNMPDRPLYLVSEQRSLFGVLHPPGGGVASGTGTGVLICPPFGLEDSFSYRIRRLWAQHLADEGHTALRVDLPGTGDSPGGPGDPGRVEAWTDAIVASAQWLRDQGCGRVALIGIGLGGLIAGRALALGAPVDGMVMWATPAKGKRFLRELRAFANLEASFINMESEYVLADDAAPEGSIEVGGYGLSPETVVELEALDLGPLLADSGRATDVPVLLLERDGISVDRGLRAAFTDAGADVTLNPGPGFGAMMAEPHTAQPPRQVFTQVDDWLAAVPVRPVEAPALEPLEARDTLELDVDGTALTETPVAIEQPFGRLFGVLTQPADADERRGLTAVLLNTGAQRRTGPNRMWVEAARRWAADGVSTLRLDIAGTGDADTDVLEWADDEAFNVHVPEFVAQVRAALDGLAERGVPDRFVLAGLCSGAYWSFQAALQDPRVAAGVLINPSALLYTPWLATSRQAKRAHKLRQGRIRARLMSRQIPIREIWRIAKALIGYPVAWLQHRLGRDEMDHAFDQLREQGTNIVVLFTPGEQVYEELSAEGRVERLSGRENVDITELPGEGWAHTLQPLPLQRYVHRVLDDALHRELDRLPAAAVPTTP